MSPASDTTTLALLNESVVPSRLAGTPENPPTEYIKLPELLLILLIMDCSGTLDVAGAANCEDAVNERCTKDTAEQLLVS